MNSKYINFDKIFFNWIFIWVFVYVLAGYYTETDIGNFIFENTNPIYMLYVALLDNIYVVLVLLYYNPKLNIIIKYCILIALIKIIPFYLLEDTPINIIPNILFSIFFFIVFSVYVFIKYNTNFFAIHHKINESLLKDDNNTHFNAFLNDITKHRLTQ
jgi:hypothetical protein